MTTPTHKQLVRLSVLGSIFFFLAVVPATGDEGDPIRGAKLFHGLGCQTCHTVHGQGGPSGAGGATETKAPELANIFGTTVEMGDGKKVVVDEAYLLQSITDPNALICMDHETGRPYPKDKMPARFKHLPERDLAGLVAYLKGLSGVGPTQGGGQIACEQRQSRPVWVWALLGCCGGIVALVSVVNMKRNISWGWIALIVLIPVLGTASGMGFAYYNVAGSSHREIHIKARQFAYDPPIIKVQRGDRVTITLESQDVLHGFYLDGYGIDKEIRPGEKNQFSFIAHKPGRFSYRCSHTCGVFHPFMIGNLFVEPNYLFPGSIGLCFGLGLATFCYIAKKKE